MMFRDASAPPPRVPALAMAAILAAAGAAGAGWVVGGSTSAGAWLRSLFELYVDAQLTMLEASGNLNADGAAEYAVVLREPLPEADVIALVARHDGVQYLRRTVFERAIVVSMTAGDRAALAALGADPRVGAVLPNRGLWICH